MLMKITKRNGTSEEVNLAKIKNAIRAALANCDYDVKSESIIGVIDSITNEVSLYDGIPVEEIQDQIIELLRDYDYDDVANAYLLYKEERRNLHLYLDKLNYMNNYASAKENANDLSNTDPNANASAKNLVSLEGEVYKDMNRNLRRLDMKMLLNKYAEEFNYDPSLSKQYERDLNSHIFYQHDEASSPVRKIYCSAYSLYPLLLHGTNCIDGTKNTAPKHLHSFCGQFCNLVFTLSAAKKGAGAYGEFFNFFTYFCEKEWGTDFYKKADVVVTTDHCLTQQTIGDVIDSYFQSVTHYINQPAGNRGAQSPSNLCFSNRTFYLVGGR